MKEDRLESQIKRLKDGFVEYVRKRGGMGLCDSLGGPIELSEKGNPMWNQDLVIYRDGSNAHVRVFLGGCVCEDDGHKEAMFIREFAEESGASQVVVSFDSKSFNSDGKFTLEIFASFGLECASEEDSRK